MKQASKCLLVIWCACTAFMPGCGGSGCESSDGKFGADNPGWVVEDIADLNAGPGQIVHATVIVKHTDTKVGNPHTVEISATVPSGWTATVVPDNVTVTNPLQNGVADVAITVPVGATPGSYPCSVKCVSGAPFKVVPFDVVIGAPSLTTGITKLTDFAAENDGVYSSRFRVDNGPPLGLVGSLQFAIVPDVMYWYRPDNVLDLHSNESQEFELAAIALNSTKLGPHTVEASFSKQGQKYAYNSMFTVPPTPGLEFLIQPDQMGGKMAVSHSTIGDKAAFQVIVDLPPAKPGQYTLAISRGGPGLAFRVTPPTATIDANGTPVTFGVEVERTTADPSFGVKTHELLITGTHGNSPETNFRQVVPIYSTP